MMAADIPEKYEIQKIAVNFDDTPIRLVRTPDVWFCGKDVAFILGYKDTKDALRKHVGGDDRKSIGSIFEEVGLLFPDNNRVSKTVYINCRGVSTLVSRSRTVKNKKTFLEWLDKNFGINYCIAKKLYREEQFISNIEEAFAHVQSAKQFRVGSYKIDIYFPAFKIAVECDEFGHADRDKDAEREREAFIRDNLGCKFVRFNPDSPTFSIFKVICDISAIIMND